MTDLSFRKMEKVDLPAVVKIENDCQSHPWSLLQFLDGFNAGHSGWLACRQSGNSELLVGFAVTSTVLDESTLLNLCVRPTYQNRGYGRRLLQFVLARAADAGISKVFLEVRASNQGAIHLYESQGFEQVTVRKDYYPALIGREDGLVYALSSLEAS